MTRKVALVAPDDLDEAGLLKWSELAARIKVSQAPLLANLCRNHSNLLAIRRAKAEAVKSGTYQAMTIAKNGSLGPNPFMKAETKLLTLENRMILALGLGDEWTSSKY
jgi:hypothetical protein